MRGKASTAEVLKAWKLLSPEEKVPYDLEAAARRTSLYLDEAAGAAASVEGGGAGNLSALPQSAALPNPSAASDSAP